MSDLVISSSALSAFRRCPASYKFGYVMNLQYMGVPRYVNDGSDFHSLAAMAGRFVRNGEVCSDTFEPNIPMVQVLEAWLKARGDREFAEMREILHVEEPMYTKLIDGVRLRTTFDLVYRNADGWIVCRDYKTFEKRPSTDADLDFQARGYIAALMQKYKTRKVMFEHVYIRRVPPGTANSKGVWGEDECYIYEPIVISPREAGVLWREAQATAEAIVHARERGGAAFWRTDLKGNSPYTCGSCFFKHVCKAEIEQGNLDDQTISILNYSVREPLTLPEEVNA